MDNNKVTCTEPAKKIKYNPSIHSININNTEDKKPFRRYWKLEKKRRKALEKELRYIEDYNDLMLSNLIKELYTSKSPYLLISRKWVRKMKDNIILLNSGRESKNNNNRVIYYNI